MRTARSLCKFHFLFNQSTMSQFRTLVEERVHLTQGQKREQKEVLRKIVLLFHKKLRMITTDLCSNTPSLITEKFNFNQIHDQYFDTMRRAFNSINSINGRNGNGTITFCHCSKFNKMVKEKQVSSGWCEAMMTHPVYINKLDFGVTVDPDCVTSKPHNLNHEEVPQRIIAKNNRKTGAQSVNVPIFSSIFQQIFSGKIGQYKTRYNKQNFRQKSSASLQQKDTEMHLHANVLRYYVIPPAEFKQRLHAAGILDHADVEERYLSEIVSSRIS
ncbi:hypothetical protein WN51_10817 [Melipona quadrifasciata]|uniref:Uncharacterized protein n=1 Tax=Melipona quadrifasciata TaxID=166423 RepID=A0A0N0BHZ5_9HYME|nr:hypothetical protein WN51_10817 [Melipona quadrifasciata]